MGRSANVTNQQRRLKYSHLIFAVLALSAFTHIWNAAGFPDIFFDEGIYMRRAMHVMAGQGPQESFFHDHPFFGQILLASVLDVVGFPSSIHPSANSESISNLYLVPRIVMGLLAVVDTFLIYRIADSRYGQRVALLSSALFAVMPITWILRRILLDSILLPFVLASILFAIDSKNRDKKQPVILASGICMGLAIFTKIPVFTLIPLVVGLIYFGNGKKARHVILWLIPVILIPLMWPLQSIQAGQFNLWVGDVLSQTDRHSYGLPYISKMFLEMDPVLFVLGVGGMALSICRRDYFVLMWIVPFVIFLLAIGFNQYFYWIPVLPIFCIGASLLLSKFLDYAKRKRQDLKLPHVAILAILAFGLVNTILLVTTDMTSGEFDVAAYVLQHTRDGDQTTVLASPTYSWIFNYVFHRPNVPIDYSSVLWQPVSTPKTLLIVDHHYLIDMGRGIQLRNLYEGSKTVANFTGNAEKYDITSYPFTNLKVNYEGNSVEIREKG